MNFLVVYSYFQFIITNAAFTAHYNVILNQINCIFNRQIYIIMHMRERQDVNVPHTIALLYVSRSCIITDILASCNSQEGIQYLMAKRNSIWLLDYLMCCVYSVRRTVRHVKHLLWSVHQNTVAKYHGTTSA